MCRFLLLAALLLTLLAGRAAAQAPPLPGAPALAAASAPTDTVAALHRLFAERRRRRNVIAGATGGLTVAGVVGAANSRGGGDLNTAIAITFGILGGTAVTGELFFFKKYSPAREQRAVESFQAHRLDRDLRRKLKPRYFR